LDRKSIAVFHGYLNHVAVDINGVSSDLISWAGQSTSSQYSRSHFRSVPAVYSACNCKHHVSESLEYRF
jgi:hypothetical protein